MAIHTTATRRFLGDNTWRSSGFGFASVENWQPWHEHLLVLYREVASVGKSCSSQILKKLPRPAVSGYLPYNINGCDEEGRMQIQPAILRVGTGKKMCAVIASFIARAKFKNL
jgi:hypothetical protein